MNNQDRQNIAAIIVDLKYALEQDVRTDRPWSYTARAIDEAIDELMSLIEPTARSGDRLDHSNQSHARRAFPWLNP